MIRYGQQYMQDEEYSFCMAYEEYTLCTAVAYNKSRRIGKASSNMSKGGDVGVSTIKW